MERGKVKMSLALDMLNLECLWDLSADVSFAGINSFLTDHKVKRIPEKQSIPSIII